VKPLPRDADPRLLELRASANFEPYMPTGAAPDWLFSLEAVAESETGIWALLGPCGVSTSNQDGKRVRVTPEPLGLFLAGLSSRLRWTGQRIAIGMPPAGKHLLLFMASTVVLSSSLDTLGATSLTRGGVLVISPDLDLRSRYGDLCVGQIKLDDAFP
jgi:hypothetical protein